MAQERSLELQQNQLKNLISTSMPIHSPVHSTTHSLYSHASSAPYPSQINSHLNSNTKPPKTQSLHERESLTVTDQHRLYALQQQHNYKQLQTQEFAESTRHMFTTGTGSITGTNPQLPPTNDQFQSESGSQLELDSFVHHNQLPPHPPSASASYPLKSSSSNSQAFDMDFFRTVDFDPKEGVGAAFASNLAWTGNGVDVDQDAEDVASAWIDFDGNDRSTSA